MIWLAVAAGGAAGAILRFAVVTLAGRLFGLGFPYGTLLVNVIGSLLIGILAVLFQARYPEHDALRAFLIVGVLGGFTTFSAFSLDTFLLLDTGAYLKASANILLNVMLCVIAAGTGMLISKHLIS